MKTPTRLIKTVPVKTISRKFFIKNSLDKGLRIQAFQPLLGSLFYTPNRQFSTSSVAFKKGGKAKGKLKADKSDVTEKQPEGVDQRQFLEALEKKYKEALEMYRKKSLESKLGKADARILDHLTIKLPHNETAKFTDVAQTTLKGRTLMITLFDPSVAKSVVLAVIGADLNLNPQVDLKNPQLLKAPLPAATADLKLEAVKNLKAVYNTFKSSNSKHAFTTIRADAVKTAKKDAGSEDESRKLVQKIEALNKDYNKKLADALKEFEKSAME